MEVKSRTILSIKEDALVWVLATMPHDDSVLKEMREKTLYYIPFNDDKHSKRSSINFNFYIALCNIQRRQWHPTPVPLPENPMDGGA